MHGSSPCFILGNFKSQVTLGTANHLLVSGQVTIIHQPGNQGIPLLKLPFGVTSAEAVLICPEIHIPCFCFRGLIVQERHNSDFPVPVTPMVRKVKRLKGKSKDLLIGKLTWNPKMEVGDVQVPC